MSAAPSRPLRWLPLATFLVLAFVLTGGWLYTIAAARDNARAQDRVIAEQTALRVSDWLNTRLAILRSLSTLAQAGHPDAEGSWSGRLTHVITEVGGFQAVNWIDDHGIITRVAPLAGNAAAIGRDLLRHPVVGPTLADAMARLTTRLSPPLDLYQGGRGFTAYVPVRRGADGPLVGLVNGVFRTDHLAAACLQQLDATHHLRIVDGPALVIATPGPEPPSAPSIHVPIPVADRTWTLSLRARADVFPVALSLLLLGVGLALAAGLAWVLRVALTRQAEVARAHAERADMAARLRAAERLEAMGHLAGGVAHDFNNLLTVIRGRADLLATLLDDTPDDREALADNVDAILDASSRAADVTSQLLAFARREPVSHGTVDLAAHLRAIAPMLRNLATEAVTITLDLPATPLWTACPAGVIDRILVNLVANARDATSQRGHIRLAAHPEQDQVRIDVADDGRGMPPDVLARAFEPFFTTRASGSGLGLATVYGLVTQRGGTIDTDSALGRGTTFTLRLPAAPPPLHTAPPPAPRHAGAAGPRAAHVFVVEDNAAVRAIIVRSLTTAGFTVDDFGDGEAAIAAARRPDVLVTDLVLPGLDGVAVARHLRERQPTLGVVIASGYSDQPGAVDAALADGALFLAKPFQMAELVALVRRLAPPAPAPAEPPLGSPAAATR